MESTCETLSLVELRADVKELRNLVDMLYERRNGSGRP